MSAHIETLGSADEVTVNDGASTEMNYTPFLPGTTVACFINSSGFTGTCLVEGSDTGAFAGEETTLATSGALTTSDAVEIEGIVLSKYMRYSVTVRSAGDVNVRLVAGI